MPTRLTVRGVTNNNLAHAEQQQVSNRDGKVGIKCRYKCKLRILLKQNTALLSTVRASVTGMTSQMFSPGGEGSGSCLMEFSVGS